MRIIKLLLLGLLRVIGGLIALVQIIGLIPVMSWLSDIGSVTSSMWASFGVKVFFLFLGIALYQGLKKPFNRIKKEPADPATSTVK